MHTRLAEQLAQFKGEAGDIDLEPFLDDVSRVYRECDEERERVELATELMVAEVEVLSRDRNATLARLADEKARLAAAIDNMGQALAMYDGPGRLLLSNEKYKELLRLDGIAVGSPFGEVVDQLAGAIVVAPDGQEQSLAGLREAVMAGGWVERTITLANGRILSSTYRPLENAGWVELHRDITEQSRAEERIRFLARHDILTNLPNRLVFKERLEAELLRVARGSQLAVLCIDLDHFKNVNDALGHPVGDRLLQIVSRRLSGALRRVDVVARTGGDEFSVVQVDSRQPHGASVVAKRLLDVLQAPYEIDGHQIIIGASIGVAISPDDGVDAQALLRNADMALCRAKAEGRGSFKFFEPEMDARMQARRRTELDLRRAIATEEFELDYQPLIDLRSGRIVSCEALVRWRHHERGRIPPDQFIPLAEENGMIMAIGSWVFREAFAEAARWPGDVRLSVNVSPVQFKAAGLVHTVRDALARSGLSPRRLDVEITEAVVLQSSEQTFATLQALRDLGVRIVMDDFGTGYSSLNYLSKFPFDKIKIDRSFVNDMTEKREANAVVKAVADLAASLGMSTTAEGVETPAQLALLRDMGCTEAQGFLICRPKPGNEVRRFLENAGDVLKELVRTSYAGPAPEAGSQFPETVDGDRARRFKLVSSGG